MNDLIDEMYVSPFTNCDHFMTLFGGVMCWLTSLLIVGSIIWGITFLF